MCGRVSVQRKQNLIQELELELEERARDAPIMHLISRKIMHEFIKLSRESENVKVCQRLQGN